MKTLLKNVSVLSYNNKFEILKNANFLRYNNKFEILQNNNTCNVDNVLQNDYVIMPKLFNFNDYLNNATFNLNNFSVESLNKQLTMFKNNNITPFMFIDNIIEAEPYLDQIVMFSKKNNVKIAVCAGKTLNEMGECDKLFGLSPINLLEEYGVLDLEPIIVGATNLDKEDFEKLNYYNASICLTLTEDLLNGNGIPPIVTIIKNNINVFFSSEHNDIFKEMFLCYSLPKGMLNNSEVVGLTDVLKMALINGYVALNKQNLFNNLDSFMVCKADNNNLFESLVLFGNPDKIVKICYWNLLLNVI